MFPMPEHPLRLTVLEEEADRLRAKLDGIAETRAYADLDPDVDEIFREEADGLLTELLEIRREIERITKED